MRKSSELRHSRVEGRMVGIMADEEYTTSMYNTNHMSTFEEGYDSEEEFLDNTQFEDPPDFVDTVDDDGTCQVVAHCIVIFAWVRGFCHWLLVNFVDLLVL